LVRLSVCCRARPRPACDRRRRLRRRPDE
jgi:hypothetical protein